MKKYKVYFSIFNILEETQKEVARLQFFTKTLTGMLAGLSYLAESTDSLTYVAIGGFLIDGALHCLWFEKKE